MPWRSECCDEVSSGTNDATHTYAGETMIDLKLTFRYTCVTVMLAFAFFIGRRLPTSSAGGVGDFYQVEKKHSGIEQMAARRVHNPEVAGSSPAPAIFAPHRLVDGELPSLGRSVRPGSPVRYKEVLMRVTAYCPCEKCCGRWSDGFTASGKPVDANGGAFVAADRSVPIGTLLTVEGYNQGRPVEVLDRGGAIKGDRLDVFFPNHQDALEWGVRHLKVQIYDF